MKLYCCKDFRKHELICGQMDIYVDEQSYVRKEERQMILWPTSGVKEVRMNQSLHSLCSLSDGRSVASSTGNSPQSEI
jgi:hypothetical protein